MCVGGGGGQPRKYWVDVRGGRRGGGMRMKHARNVSGVGREREGEKGRKGERGGGGRQTDTQTGAERQREREN